jgi:bacillithiol biosynthesis cysteine-adding enzyme BshC
MQLEKISFADTHAFHPFFLDYIQQKESLRPFYNRFPSLGEFKQQIAEKQAAFTNDRRATLVDVLQRQYKDVTAPEAVQANINALGDSKTFTVTTGHQLNIFTGPLYFIYKIVTVINACRQLKEQYPDYTFVPVYWMASEDHDYDEIKYFRLYNKKYTWETPQQGAVGRFSTKDMAALLREVPGDIRLFQEAYTKNKTLSGAVRHYVNGLFGAEGLVVIDADEAAFKAGFREVIRQDIFDNIAKKQVDQTTQALEAQGYKPAVNGRDINFFYLDNGLRARIEKAGDTFQVVDTDISFTADALRELIDKQPEKFSPNVILRPLYQEMILPNLAYAGGPSEVEYWLQLGGVFKHFQVPFPILMPRNFALVMEHTAYRKFLKTDLHIRDFFEDKNYIYNHWVLQHSPRNLTVGKERTEMQALFETLRQRAQEIDITLAAYVAAEGKRALSGLEKIEHKLLRAEKRLHTDTLRQVDAVKDLLFPNGNLQERTDNFLNFYQQDPQFIQHLFAHFDPFDFQFYIFAYEQPLVNPA